MEQNILSQIVETKRNEVEQSKKALPFEILEENVSKLTNSPKRSLKHSLLNSQSGIIAEFKRKSPSKGWIKENGKPEIIPLSYQDNGASGLSILTDQKYFGGSTDFIKRARPCVDLPILRKDFIIDKYQIYEAKIIGADAILLIAACLSIEQTNELANIAKGLDLEVLLEIHNAEETKHISSDIDLVGVNNRNLKTFETSINTSIQLADGLNSLEQTIISESGIHSPEDVALLRSYGYKGFLMGETFMKEEQPGLALSRFINKLKEL